MPRQSFSSSNTTSLPRKCICIGILVTALLSLCNLWFLIVLPFEELELEMDSTTPRDGDSLFNQPRFHDKTTAENNGKDNDIAEEEDGLEPCRVVIESKGDMHHEIIESTIHSYPLTTQHLDSKEDCSNTKPVIYDFALVNARFGKHDFESIAGNTGKKHLNETEFWTWKRYIEDRFKKTKDQEGQSLERADDGRLFEYGEFIQYHEYNNRRVDMVIDITCDPTKHRVLSQWLESSEDRFCIQHGLCENCNELMMNRTCFVSPVMWPESQCTFFPTKFPRFTEAQVSLARLQYAGKDEPSDSVRVCVMGSGRNHSQTAALVEALSYEKYHTHFHVSSRNNYGKPRTQKYYKDVISKGNPVTFTVESDYEGFAKWVASCDISLLGIDPKSTPSKFPPSVVGEEKSSKKLTGLLPMVVAYEIPTVVHKEFETLYHDYWRGPVSVYNDTFESYVEALGKMAKEIYEQKTKIK